MTSDIVTGIFTLAGVALGALLNMLLQRAAARDAARAKAADLFSQIVRCLGVMEVERDMFRVRRSSWRPNLVATGTAVLHVFAARAAGNWLTGAASGVRELTAWDADEGARFAERYQASASEVITALVQLSLMSDELQAAAGKLGDAMTAAMTAKPREAEDANAALREATAGLRSAVRGYTARKPRRRRR
jgi:hypothetical protein